MSTSMIEIQKALFDAHYKTLRIKRESSYWEAHHADNYMIFSWQHQIWPREPQSWYADRTIFPSIVTENWVLKALKEKKPFLHKFKTASPWLEEKILTDIRFYEHFLQYSIVETMSAGMLFAFNFEGKIYTNPSDDFLNEFKLKVIISRNLYNNHLKHIVEI
jgi:hypothetical protein